MPLSSFFLPLPFLHRLRSFTSLFSRLSSNMHRSTRSRSDHATLSIAILSLSLSPALISRWNNRKEERGTAVYRTGTKPRNSRYACSRARVYTSGKMLVKTAWLSLALLLAEHSMRLKTGETGWKGLEAPGDIIARSPSLSPNTTNLPWLTTNARKGWSVSATRD